MHFHLPQLDLPGIRISHLGEGAGTGARQSLGQSQDEGGWRQLWLGDQMWGWGVQLSSLGGVWGGAPGAERHTRGWGEGCCWLAAGSLPRRRPPQVPVFQAGLKRPLTQVGNSDCSGEALSRVEWGGGGWLCRFRGFEKPSSIIVILYFTQMTEARGLTPGRCWVVLPSPR